MAKEDPLGIVTTDLKKLEKIRKFFEAYAADASNLSAEMQKVGKELGLIHTKSEAIKQAEQAINDIYKARAIADKDFSEILKINGELRDKELQRQKDEVKQSEEMIVKGRERLKILDEQIGREDEIKDLLDEEYKKKLDILKVERDAMGLRPGRKAALTERIDQAEEELRKKKEYVDNLGIEHATQVAIVNQHELGLEQQVRGVVQSERQGTAIKATVGGFGDMISAATGLGVSLQDGLVGGMLDAVSSGADMTKLTTDLGLKFKDLVSPLNIFKSVLAKVFEATLAFMKEFDTLTANFRKTTGIIDKGFGGMEDSIANVQRANIRMGVSMDEAFNSATALTTEMAQFTSMTKDSQQQVLKATALLGEFGVSADTTAQIFNTFSKGLGYNAQQLENVSTQLMAVSTSLKIPPNIIATEFNAASKELAKYGDEMMNVFSGIAEQSKQTGLAMQDLLGVAKQFDTFEDAGNAVGRLNAILGGPYLNAIEMLYATEEDRIKLLRQSVSLTGQQFKDMERFEKQAIMNAAGITDMTTALKLFGGTDSEYARHSMEMKEMEARAIKAQSVQDKFMQTMQSFAIALGPLVDILGVLVDALNVMLQPFSLFSDTLGPDATRWLNTLATGVLVLSLAIKTNLIPSLNAMGAAWSTVLGPIAAAIAAFYIVQGLFAVLPDSMKPLVTAIIALASAIVLFRFIGGDLSAPVQFAIAGAAIAATGAAASATLKDTFAEGVDNYAGGTALVGEQGPELITTKGGGAAVAQGPSVVDLPQGSNVINNENVKRLTQFVSQDIDTQGAGDPKLLATLTSLGTAIANLNTLLRNSETAPAEDEKRVVIEMDGKKVADQVIARLNKKSRLTITKA